jgi:guanylate kinase
MAGVKAPLFIVLAGPAGSGKSTLCERLLGECPDFSRVVTTTTRAPRPGEINGVHYHFLTPREFRRRITAGDFLEWAQVHGERDDRLYGTLRASVFEPLAQGRNLILSIDVQGVDNLRRIASHDARLRQSMTTVFILVDRARMVARMRKRAQDNDAEIARRLQTAEAEMREAPKFDFRIESRSRDEDFGELLRIVQEIRQRTAEA